MASITKRKTGTWQAQVRRHGYEGLSRSFDSKGDAEVWARRIESEMDRGVYIDRTESERTTLAEALERYRREIVPVKRHPYQENQRINRWLDYALTKRSLANLRGADFATYRDARRAAGRAENTIRLELALIGHLFEMARKEWGMEGLMNPLKNIRKPSGSKLRERRLLPGEQELLSRLLREGRNAWAEPAMILAIETALRQAMLFELQWSWVDLDARVITIPPACRGVENKSVPSELPLSSRALKALRELPRSIDGRVLATTQNAVVCAFKAAKKRYLDECRTQGEKPSALEDLRWHDLRHESASRLFERGLGEMEVASITGHKTMQTLKRYTHLNARNLLAKLG